MYYTVYKTTNLINGKYYIGLHTTNNLNDEYLGSGRNLKLAIKKYGKVNFIKETLFIFNNKGDMIKKEIELITEDIVNDENSYNIAKGGFGLSTLDEEKRKETIKKIQLSNAKNNHQEIYKKRKETLLKQSDNIFKIIGEKSGLKQKESYKNGYINPRSIHKLINIYDNNDKIIHTCKFYELKKICKEHNLPVRVIEISVRSHGTPLYYNKMSPNKEFKQYYMWYALFEDDTRIDLEKWKKDNDIKKDIVKNKLSKPSKFKGISSKEHKLKTYLIKDNKDNIIYKFTNSIKGGLKELNLPENIFYNSFYYNKRITHKEYNGWVMLLL